MENNFLKKSLWEKVELKNIYFITKFGTEFLSTLITLMFILLICIFSIVLLFQYSKCEKDHSSKGKEVLNKVSRILLIFGIVIYLFSWIIIFAYALSFADFDFSGINFFDQILTSLTKIFVTVAVTIALCIFTLSLWRIPRGILMVLFIILAIAILIYFINAIHSLVNVVGIITFITYVNLIFQKFNNFKGKFEQLGQDIRNASLHLHNSKRMLFSSFLKSSIFFLLQISSIFFIISKKNVSTFQYWFFFLLIDFSYCVYVNYNTMSISYYISKNEPNTFTSSVTFQDYLIILYQTIQNQLFLVYKIFYNILGFIFVVDFNDKIIAIERNFKNTFRRKSDLNEYSFVYMGINKQKTEKEFVYSIKNKQDLSERVFLRIFYIKDILIRIPIHLTLFFIKFYYDSFGSIKKYSNLGILAYPVNLLNNLFQGISIESMSNFLAYCILFLLFVAMEIAFYTNEVMNENMGKISSDTDQIVIEKKEAITILAQSSKI